MDVKELTSLLAASATRLNQSRYIPWWEDDFENCVYRYSIFPKDMAAEAERCAAQCSPETLLAPGSCESCGLTLFQLLVWHNFYDAVKNILESKRISGRDIDRPDHSGCGLTPFLLACCRGNLAMARLLLDYGADCRLSDKRGMNPYHFLAYPRIEGLANCCNEHTPDQREAIARLLTCDINQRDQNGLTPLARLVSTSYCSDFTWPLTEVFLDQGAETDYVDENGDSLLMLAMKNGHLTGALQLMNRHKELVHGANREGITPIQHAHRWNNEGLCLALADCGAAPVSAPMDMDHLSQITSNAFCSRSRNDQDNISLALYLTEKLISQVDADDDDELGYITDILHNALVSDKKFRVLDTFRKAGLDFTMPIHFRGSIVCLRDKCLAIAYGADVIRKMTELGVDMDAAVINGRTPACIIASMSGGSPAFREENHAFFREAAELLSRESMEQLDHSGRAAIHLAAQNGHETMMAAMIEKGVDVNLTEDAPAQPGTTPLHEACLHGHWQVARLLMAAGADDTLKNFRGETPAHWAVMAKSLGRDLDSKQKIAVLKELNHVDIPREDGKTPLMLVQFLGHFVGRELIPVFLEKGADVNRRDNQGMTPLMLNADHSCSKDTVKQLILAGADVNLADNEGNTALHYSLGFGDVAAARYLIKKGADYNRPNNQGRTAAQLAVEKGFDTVLALMTDIR